MELGFAQGIAIGMLIGALAISFAYMSYYQKRIDEICKEYEIIINKMKEILRKGNE